MLRSLASLTTRRPRLATLVVLLLLVVGIGAVALLARQAARADQRFQLTDANVAAAIDLCEQLDGIALAIEMAAARVAAIGIDAVQGLLAQRLKLSAPTKFDTFATSRMMSMASASASFRERALS